MAIGMGLRHVQPAVDESPAPVRVSIRTAEVREEGSSGASTSLLKPAIEAELARVPGIVLVQATDSSTLEVTPYASVKGDSATIWAIIREPQSDKPSISVRPVRAGQLEVEHGMAEIARRVAGSVALRIQPRYSEVAPYLSQPGSYESVAGMLSMLHTDPSIDEAPTDTIIARLSALHMADPTFSLPLVRAVMSLYHDARCEDMENVITQITSSAISPPVHENLTVKIHQAWCRGRFDEAVAHARARHALAPNAWTSVTMLANALTWANRPREAYAIAADRNDVLYGPAAFQTGVLPLHASGDHRRELKLIKELRRRYTNLWVLAFESANYAASGRIQDLERVVAEAESLPSGDGLSPGDVAIRAAIELAGHGRDEDAARYLRRGLEWYQRNPKLLGTEAGRLNYALTLLAAGELEKARPYFARLADANPQDIVAVGALGYIAAREGRTADATQASESLRLLEGKFTRGRATLWRARIANALGQQDTAVDLIRDALSQGTPIWSSIGSGPIDDATLHRIPDLQNLLRDPRVARLVAPRG